jgi:type III secretion system YopN/LcrE/InvE/MxiC family regulator
MAFDAAQILRQTYAAGVSAMQQIGDVMDGSDDVADVQRGELMGTALEVDDDAMADLMDSMEELATQFEEAAVKKMAERRMGPIQGSRAAFVRALEAWRSLMPDMPGRDKLDRFAKMLREAKVSGRLPSVDSLLRVLARESTDASHQFAMLDLLEQMMGEGDAELLELVKQAKAKLMAEKGPDVKAGINLAEEINARASTPEEMQGLRDLYRAEVVGFTKPQDCFRSLLASRGAGGLKDAIAFLMAGCGRDLASANPSIEHEALGRILTDLQCVQVLQTVMEKLSQLGARMEAQFGEPCMLDGEQMTGRVVELTEQAFVTSVAVARLVAECGMAKLLAQMDFTRELTRIFRQLSPRLFAKEGDRQRLVEAAQDHLDELVSRENAEEEEKAS